MPGELEVRELKLGFIVSRTFIARYSTAWWPSHCAGEWENKKCSDSGVSKAMARTDNGGNKR